MSPTEAVFVSWEPFQSFHRRPVRLSVYPPVCSMHVRLTWRDIGSDSFKRLFKTYLFSTCTEASTKWQVHMMIRYVHRRFYPRDAMLAQFFATATCLSVRPSVCHEPYWVKMKKATVMISSPSGKHHDSSFLMPNFITKFYGFSRAGASKKARWKYSAIF